MEHRKEEEEKKQRKPSTSSTKEKGIEINAPNKYCSRNIAVVDPKKLMDETIKKHEAFQFLVKKRSSNTERKISRIESLNFNETPVSAGQV